MRLSDTYWHNYKLQTNEDLYSPPTLKHVGETGEKKKSEEKYYFYDVQMHT